MRAWLEPARARLRRDGLPAVDHGFLDSFSLELDGKAGRYAQLLRDLPAGLSEWAVHPALADASPVRRSDYDFLVSEEAAAIVRQQEIRIIGYRRLQQRWDVGDGAGPRDAGLPPCP